MLVRRLRDDGGNVLVTVVLVAMVVGALAALGLDTARQADWASASDRNHDQALGVAEAGIHRAISKIAAQSAAGDLTIWNLDVGQTLPAPCDNLASTAPPNTCAASKTTTGFNGETPQGTYWNWVTRTSDGFIIDAQATSGGKSLGRGRHIRAVLAPPLRFNSNEAYALFSKTSIDIQAGDEILDGDIYANQWIDIGNAGAINPSVRGNVTSGTSWIRLQSGVRVTGNVWSGGPHASGALRMENGSKIDGWAKASSSVPGCTAQDPLTYDVPMGSGSIIAKTLTTFGQKTGVGTVQGGTPTSGTCTASATPPAFPGFSFDIDSYKGIKQEFSSLQAFKTYFAAHKSNFQGTFRITLDPTGADASIPPANRIVDLTGAVMTGSLTLVTDAPPPTNPDDAGYGIPVSTENISDAGVADSAVFVIVSHYKPKAGTACTTEGASDCAVQIKNNFSTDASGVCKVATLVYADNGPVAIKNSGDTCGSVVSNGIQVKNGLTLTYDKRIDRVVGFGPTAFEIARWEERASS